DHDGLTCNPRSICRLSDRAEQFGSVLLTALLILVCGIFDNLRVEGEDMKWHLDREHRNFGADFLGKGDAVLDSLLSEFRAVSRYQYIFVHRFPPPSHPCFVPGDNVQGHPALKLRHHSTLHKEETFA